MAAQREQLITRMRREGFAHTCEAVAYTWFNRFAALRYMELHDYLGRGSGFAGPQAQRPPRGAGSYTQ